MKKEWIPGKNGYTIPGIHTLTGKEAKIAVIAHGFGSSKESPTAAMLGEQFPAWGIGTIAFDFPAHGESPVGGEMLTVENCLADLQAAEETARRLCPHAEIGYFGSSFGAYITLLYLASGKAAGRKAFLRSAAVEIPELLPELTADFAGDLERQGWFLFDAGYVRPLRLTRTLFNELAENDVFEKYQPGSAELFMVHGSGDETASPQAARRFAEFSGAELAMLSGGDHRLSLPGMPEKVLQLAREFFETPGDKG